MNSVRCTNCGADVTAIDGSPCPQCGRIVTRARMTSSFDTVRKVTDKAEYGADTERRTLGMVSLYKSYPKFKCFNIKVACITGAILTGMSLLIDIMFAGLGGTLVTIVTNVAGVFIGIFVVLKFAPKVLVGAEWHDWVKMTRS